MLVLALDVGTSSTRAQCFDDDGRALPEAHARVAYEAAVTADGAVELDVETLLEAVGEAIDGCLTRLGPRDREIDAVGASVFWHSLFGLGADGTPLTSLMTWADTRSAADASALRQRLDERAVHARTGAPIHATFYPARLRWLRRARPAVFERAAQWCGFAEYLALRLTGRLSVSVSMASGTGLLHQSTQAWDDELLAACGITPERLPPISDAPAQGLTSPFAERWPRLARALWYPGWGDGACSNLGSDCAGPSRLALNVGTSSALRMVVGRAAGRRGAGAPPSEASGSGERAAGRRGAGAPPSEASNMENTPAGLWRYRVDAARSIVGGATSEGGNVVSWCRRTLALPTGDAALELALEAMPPDGHGLTALPFLAGERSPGWRADARGALTGISLDTDGVAVLRAFMEAVAYRLGMVYDRLAPLAANGHRVIASGGALHRSRAWATIMADVLGVPLTMSAEPEASIRGAALLTLEALGAPAPPPLPAGAIITPDPGRHAVYRAARERQRGLYDNIVGPPLS
jgi:gluconokinase